MMPLELELIQMARDIGEIKGMIQGLAGPNGRVTAIEEELRTTNTRNWIRTACVLPIVGALHLVARKLGW